MGLVPQRVKVIHRGTTVLVRTISSFFFLIFEFTIDASERQNDLVKLQVPKLTVMKIGYQSKRHPADRTVLPALERVISH